MDNIRNIQKKLVFGETEPFTYHVYNENNLVVKICGCNVANADGIKLFAELKDKIQKPTAIIIACSVTDYFMKISFMRIRELQEIYPHYKFFITGCMNDEIAKKYEKFGTIVRKDKMWDINSYLY